MNAHIACTRRTFLALAAGSLAAAALPARASASTRANGAIRLALIGCGAQGSALLEAFLRRPDVTVTAVSDAHAGRLEGAATRATARPCLRWDEAIAAPDVDAVVIAAPDHWHATMAMAALRAGKDVYCERPMALTLEDARAFRDAARASDRIVQIGAQETSEGRWRAAHELIRAGAIGHVLWSQGSYSRYAPNSATVPASIDPADVDWEAFVGPAPKRAFDAERFMAWRKYWDYCGGIATDQHFHKLAALLTAVGAQAPRRVSAAGGVYVRDGREVPDSFVMTAEYPHANGRGGHSIVLASSVAAKRALPAVIRGDEATLYCEEASIRVVPEPRYVDQFKHRFGATISAQVPVPARPDHLSDWLDAVRTRRAPACDPELAYHAMTAVALALHAYREGRTLYWDAQREQLAGAGQAERLATV